MKFFIVFFFIFFLQNLWVDDDIDDEHFDYFDDDLNDDDDFDDEIPLHPYIGTPCHLPTWTAPPYNWKRSNLIWTIFISVHEGLILQLDKIKFDLIFSSWVKFDFPNFYFFGHEYMQLDKIKFDFVVVG